MIENKNIFNLSHFLEIMRERDSIRAFLPVKLSQKRIERLLEVAGHAPSWCNAQPWKAYVVSSEVLNKISKDLLEAARDREDKPDIPFVPDYEDPFASRKKEADEALRLARGLKENDYREIVDSVLANWRFFGAPHALFLTIPKSFGPYALLDLGCFLQSFLLACVADGFGACPQASLAQYPLSVRKNIPIGSDELIVCGVSFGLPDSSVDRCKTSRIPLPEFVQFHEQMSPTP